MNNKFNILYVHGYNGSGNGETALTLQKLLDPQKFNLIRPNFSNIIADIEENIRKINEIIDKYSPEIIIGNSLGTFEVMNAKSGPYRVLINPVFNPVTDSLKPEIFDDSFPDISDRISELADSLELGNGDDGKIYAFFGELDDVVNCQAQFEKMFGEHNMTVFSKVGHKFFEYELGLMAEYIDGLI